MTSKKGPRNKSLRQNGAQKCDQCHRRAGHHGSHHADSGLAWDGRQGAMRIQANHYRDCPGRGRFIAMTVLVLPRTWEPTLVFLAFTLFSITFSVPGKFKLIPFAVGSIVLCAAFTWGTGYRVEPGDGPFWSRVIPPSKEELNRNFWIHIGAVSAFIAAYVLLIVVLSFLVAGGQGFATTHTLTTKGVLITGGTIIPMLLAWILFGIPNQAHNIKLDNDGYARHILVGILTTIASALTGVLFFVLHLGGGALHDMKGGPLVAGTIFTVLIVVPIYKSIARAIWERGIHDVLNPMAPKEAWRKMSQEVHTALYHAAEGEVPTCSEKARTPTKTDRETATSSRQGRTAGA